MTALPKGWALSSVGELGEYINGRGFKKSEWSTAGRPIIRIQNLTGSGSSFNYYSGPLEDRHVVPPGSLLVSWAATLGVYRWGGPEGALNQHIFKVESFIDPEFHRYVLEHALDLMRGHTHGSGMVHITRGRFDETPIPVPPLAEQGRIVAAIEEAFSLLDAGETALHSTRTRLKRMRDSVLTAAVTGHLVPQDPTDTPAAQYLRERGVALDRPSALLPAGWTTASVGDLASVGTGSTPSRSTTRYWADGSIPWVTSGLLNDGHVVAATEFVTDIALEETPLRLWPPGTLLVAMYGEGKTRGRCAELLIEATCNQACAAISLHRPLESLRGYLHLFLDANYLAMRRLAAGGVQPNLNLGLVRAVKVPIPPPEEQARIVSEVERHFSFIEAAERAVDAGLARSAGLRRSVLKAAFEGRLVEQGPADEPASVLLERIAAERAPAAPRKRVPGRARGKAVAS